MRFALSAAILLAASSLVGTTVNAQALDFDFEPLGQEFSPPPVKIIPAGPTAAQDFSQAKAFCTSEVRNIYSYRAKIWVACLRQQLTPHGHRLIVMSNDAEVAQQYGVNVGH